MIPQPPRPARWLARQKTRALTLATRALAENASPRRFACAIAVGAFVSASPVPPVLFMRTGASIGLASILRLNRLTAFLGSHTFFGPLWLVAIGVEVRLGCRMLARPVPMLPTMHDDLAQSAARLGRESLAPWIAGSLIFAPLVGALVGALVYPFAQRWHARIARHGERPSTPT